MVGCPMSSLRVSLPHHKPMCIQSEAISAMIPYIECGLLRVSRLLDGCDGFGRSQISIGCDAVTLRIVQARGRACVACGARVPPV